MRDNFYRTAFRLLSPFFKCVFVFSVFTLTACSTINKQSNFEERRETTQIELSSKLETLWERAHIIPDLQRGAPLVSHNEAGQNAILGQNEANLALVNGLLNSLEKRVAARKQDNLLGDKMVLTLVLASDKDDTQFTTLPVTVWRGDRVYWELSSTSGDRLSMRVAWNEQGALYIEGQQVADVSLAMPTTPFVSNVFYYGEAVTAQTALSLLLSVDVNVR